MEAACGFSWVARRSAGQRWNVDKASLLGVAISGANAEPTFLAADGLYYVENTGNVIDAGAGNDYVGAAAAAADTVHGGNGDDVLLGQGDDVLVGGTGADVLNGGAGNRRASRRYSEGRNSLFWWIGFGDGSKESTELRSSGQCVDSGLPVLCNASTAKVAA